MIDLSGRVHVTGEVIGAGTVRISVCGELDALTVSAFRSGVDRLVGVSTTSVELDLAGVTFLGAAGIRAIVDLSERGNLVLVATGPVADMVLGWIRPDLLELRA